MNDYKISMTNGDFRSFRVEVSDDPQQALWQAFGVHLQDVPKHRVMKVEMVLSTDSHFVSVMGGLLRATLEDGSITEWMVHEIEVDSSEREVRMADRMRILSHTGWKHGGNFTFTNCYEFGYMHANGDEEISGFIQRPDGGVIEGLSGWYRTSDPMQAAIAAFDRLAEVLADEKVDADNAQAEARAGA